MKVLILNGCWTPNIGNAFVNLGTEQIVKQAFEGCDIFFSADVANKWFFDLASNGSQMLQNSFNISQYFQVDLVIWGGMILTKYNFELAQNIFSEYSRRKIPIIFLGAGADEYTEEEAEYVASCLKQLEYIGIITRDDRTYEMLQHYVFLKRRIARGIDAAFFVSDMSIPELDMGRYDVECFDRVVTPYIKHENDLVIQTHHDCFGKLPARYMSKANTLISELPYDYLALYKGVDTTYAERVHACIATLAFGNKARLYVDTPRAALFDRVIENGAERIKKEVVSVEKEKLQNEKERMLQNVRTFYEAFCD